MREGRLGYYTHRAVYFIGWVAVFLIMVTLLLVGYGKIESALSHQQLNKGYVVAKCYDDGHYWYSSWVLGDISITKRYGGEAYFYIQVRDDDSTKTDFWKVDLDEFDKLSVGDYVHR